MMSSDQFHPWPARAALKRRGRESGAAALVVVLMLFFVISLVAAYTSRNLIFEQRTAVNQYRSTMAFETAEAGIEWAVAMLNGGRIGDDCTVATATATSRSFRQRYLNIDASTGMVTPRVRPTGGLELFPTCIWNGTNWACSCPHDAEPSVTAPTGAGLFPAFAIRFSQNYGPITISKPGAIRIEVNGCVRFENTCLRDFSDLPVDSDGRSQHTALLALKSALTTQPAAAITVWGGSDSANLVASNTEATRGGITVHAAGAITTTPTTLVSTPGTPPARSMVADDSTLVPDGLTLGDLTAAPAISRDRVFASVFNLLPDSYRSQPAAVTLNCPVGGCRQALADLVTANPNRVIWVAGDLTLESAGTVGSMPNPADPTVAGVANVVVNGAVVVTDPAAHIYGMVYVRNMLAPASGNAWQGGGQVTGALLTEAGLSNAAQPIVTYDKSVLDTVRRSSGSFVRVPGDWRDFKGLRP